MNNHKDRFCDHRFRLGETSGYEKHKEVTCRKACAQQQKNNNPLVGKKKVAKNDGVFCKNEVLMFFGRFGRQKSEGRIGRNATTTKNRICQHGFRRDETAGYVKK